MVQDRIKVTMTD